MNAIENKMNLNIDEVISIVERDGNKKRNYLIMNKLQAKYLPVKASQAFDMFDLLAEEVKQYTGNIVVIGFAETATAIGARIAQKLAENPENKVTFLPTTREVFKQTPIVEFKEEHSHAVEQTIYGSEETFENADYIIFAEDELTTGNTILNCVKNLNFKCKYVAASLANCMSDEQIKTFKENNIEPIWLMRLDKSNYTSISGNDSINIEYENSENTNIKVENTIKLDNPRLGVDILKYFNDSIKLAENIMKNNEFTDKKVLILGTEECMYPGMIVADYLNKNGVDAYVQTTTRVPACVSQKEDYPLKTRYQVKSLYGDRFTYIYNLEKYDIAIIISDGYNMEKSVANALKSVGTESILTYLI